MLGRIASRGSLSVETCLLLAQPAKVAQFDDLSLPRRNLREGFESTMQRQERCIVLRRDIKGFIKTNLDRTSAPFASTAGTSCVYKYVPHNLS